MKSSDAPIAKEILNILIESVKVNTFIDKQYSRIKPGWDGKIRTVCSPVGTETGRFSHGDTFLEASTNLGNMPKKAAKLNPLYRVRDCLLPSSGRVFMEGDLSQAELWATAAYAGDTEKLARLRDGVDEHSALAAQIYNIKLKDVRHEYERVVGKFANHACNYGIEWRTFLKRVNKDADITGVAINAATAKLAVAGWKERNVKTVQWWKIIWDEVARTGSLETCWGRRRIFLSPLLKPTDVNAYLPQSSIADLLNMGLCELFKRHDPKLVRVSLQNHDAVLCEIVESQAMKAAAAIKECLTMPMIINGEELIIPVDISWGKDWGSMESLDTC